MLNSKMKKMTDPVRVTFEREGPLKIEHFYHVAKKYKLPYPSFDAEKYSIGCI